MSNCTLNCYSWVVAFGEKLQSPLLLLLRLYFGITWFLTGLGKLMNIDSFINYLEFLHVPMPVFNAYFVGSLEVVGGILLTIGLLSRLISIPLAIIMIVAYSTAHVDSIHQIFTNPQLFVSQSPFNYLLTTLIILAFGPGIFSIDYLVKKRINPAKP